eukprot:COSAG01_NODE_2_length_63927_cov_1357.611941_50_plen_152_part_00
MPHQTSTSLLTTNLDFPCKSEYIAIIRLTVSGIASKLNFDIEEIEDIKIAVSEACNNAVQHAYPNQAPNQARIKLFIETDDNAFRVVIKDTGIGFDPNNIDSSNAENNDKLGLGLGLAFMKSLMDHTEILSKANQGTEIKLVKKIPNQPLS